MKKKLILKIAIIFTILILFVINFSGCIKQQKEFFKEKYELSIQEMINKASSKDTIYLSSKVYHENITIDKPMTIIGKEKKTVIDGDGAKNVILIKANGVKLVNLTVRNSGGYKENSGIKIKGNYNEIINCEIYRTKKGIYLDRANDNLIYGCFFYKNAEGIYSYKSELNRIYSSQFRDNAFGISLKETEKEKIINCYVHNNGIGIYGRKCSDTEIKLSAICDNNQDGGGIWFFNSNKLKIDNCNINHNGVGIKLKNSDSKINNSNFENNMYNTIRLENVKETKINNCEIIDSYRTAIYLEESSCNIENNNFINSKLYALEIDKKSNCVAQNNYWDSKKGPSYLEIAKGEKISFRPLKIKFFPYKKEKISSIGCEWKVEEKIKKKTINREIFQYIKFSERDTDEDGIPDYWEEKWGYDPNKKDDHLNLDPDNDGLNNFEECYTDKYGSNPYYKDIFIEIDYSKNNKLSNEYIEKAKEIFKEHDICLHIDTGDLEGGEEIPINYIDSCSDFCDVYWDYFLHNNMDNPRKGIFHYAVIIDEIEEIWNGFVFIGWDNLDTIGMAIKESKDNHRYLKKDRLIIGGIIHELGHTMGLLIDDHGGIDNTGAVKFFTKQGFKYKNYFSCLNYRYVFYLLDYSDGSHGQGDFNDWDKLDFSFFKNTNFDLNK